ncbi:hypothetical protein ACT3R7_11710 [Halomonas sp. AOP43-A1-21]
MPGTKLHKADCPRCAGGKGHIDAYSHIKGGVCFKCDGKGYVMLKAAPRRSTSWRVGATNIEQTHPGDHEAGAVVYPIFTLKARSESEALKKARAKLERGEGYDASSAFVKPAV